MSTSTIRKEIRKNGALYSPSGGLVLSDSTGTFGVKRNDTDAVVVADGTAMTEVSTGIFSHSFTDPALDLIYTYAIEVLEGASLQVRFEGTLTGTVTPGSGTRLISLTRAQESPSLASLSTYTLIDVASDWLDNNYDIGPYTAGGDGVAQGVEAAVQQACVLMVQHLQNQMQASNTMGGAQKKYKIKEREKLGEYEIETETETEAEVNAGTAMIYQDVTTMMMTYQRKPLRQQPVMFTSDDPTGV
jgi:hypothetical protein